MSNKKKRNRKNIDRHKRKKMDLSLPHNQVALGATLIAIGSLLISWKLNSLGIAFWSSIFANIFAGLITGLVICLIAGRKQRTIAELESQQNFLIELSLKIKEFQSVYHELLKKQFAQFDGNEELFNFIYDVGSYANWVNDYILQGSFNEQLAIDPTEYCKEMGYDALALADEYEQLHVNLYSVDVDNPTKKQIIQYFDEVEKALRSLGGAVYHKQQSINLQLERIKYSQF